MFLVGAATIRRRRRSLQIGSTDLAFARRWLFESIAN
jgi:hypothetical protein